MIFIIIVLFAMYFLLFLPQQRRAKAQRQLMAALEPGDEILTSSGIYGLITEFDGGTAFIEVADGVEIKIARDSIASRVEYPEDELTELDETVALASDELDETVAPGSDEDED